jgi:hypothetical protein
MGRARAEGWDGSQTPKPKPPGDGPGTGGGEGQERPSGMDGEDGGGEEMEKALSRRRKRSEVELTQ